MQAAGRGATGAGPIPDLIHRVSRARSRLPLVVAIALLASLLEVAPAAAQVDDLSTAGQTARAPEVVVDHNNGRAYAVWQQSDGSTNRILLRRRLPNGNVGPVRTLSAAGQDATLPAVGIDPKGNVHTVWQQGTDPNTRIYISRHAANGNLSAAKPISPAGAHAITPAVAVTIQRHAWVVWSMRPAGGTFYRIYARVFRSNGTLGPIKVLSAGGVHATEPRVGMDRFGRIYVVWERWVNGSLDRIQFRLIRPNGTLGKRENLSAPGHESSVPQIAVNVITGTAFVVWRQVLGQNAPHIFVNRRKPDGTWRIAQVSGANSGNPHVAVDYNNRAYIVWSETDGTNTRVRLRVHLNTKTFFFNGPSQVLSASGQNAGNARIVSDRNGRTFTVWSSGGQIQSRRRAAGGKLGQIRTLSDAGRTAQFVQVAADSGGSHPYAVWESFVLSDPQDRRIQGRKVPNN